MQFWLGSLLALAASIGWSASAHATCCSRDSDCPRGFACTRSADPNAGLPGSCEFKAADCRCDSDCPTDFRCVQHAATACPDSDPSHCEPIGTCAAAWQAPCGTDADCGAGYRCSDGGETCAGTNCQRDTVCEQLPVPDTCATGSDCPSGWTCENDEAWAEQCVRWGGSCPQSGDCPPRAGKNQCRPPHWALVGASQYSGPPPDRAECPAAPGNLDAGDERAANDPKPPARKLPSNADCDVSTPGAPTALWAWPVAVLLAGLRRATRARRRAG
jgi:hypothetical protein